MFHVELRQFPNVTRAFNLSRAELLAGIVEPWLAGAAVEWDERRWNPERARITIYEGRRLGAEEMGLGRGWANVTRTGTEVTAQVLEAGRAPSPVESFNAELTELCSRRPLSLGEVMELAGARHPQARVSERLGLAEQAVWQLLHEQRVRLQLGAASVPAEEWASVLLSWEAWRADDVVVAPR